MNPRRLFSSLRWLSRLVLLLMVTAAVYSAYMSIAYWSGIAV